tara:strand:- start:319 stop:1122 length:804 start_codon:yes stop_codon:yes gene_type:complete
MIRIILFSSLILIILVSCSSLNIQENKNENQNIASPEDIYLKGMKYFNNDNYDLANQEFLELTQLYPLSNEAIQAEIMSGFIGYIKMDYESAILKFKKIAQKYPSHKDLDYVYYMIAMCNYEQITDYELDGKYNEIALESFNQVIARFPNSEYTKDSRQKIILVKSNQAAKHMNIGRFYLDQKKYIAALNRFKIVVEDYSMTKFTPEALHRMVEAYFEMGMLEDSIETASLLGYNYPDSKWYNYSYNLIKNIENKESFIKNIKNFFN